MKKFITLLLFLVSFNLYSQIDYPRYETDSLGQKIVLLTIEQAQSLDNSIDLLILFEQLNNQIINYDSVTIKVINQKEEIIAQQTIQINKLKEQLTVKDDIIKNLKETLKKDEEVIGNLEKQKSIGDEQLKKSKKEIKRLKTKMIIGGVVSGVTIFSLIYMIILS